MGKQTISVSDNAVDVAAKLNSNFTDLFNGATDQQELVELVVDEELEGVTRTQKKCLTKNENNEIVLENSNTLDVIKCDIEGYVTLEGVGYSNAIDGALVWAVLDADEKVIASVTYPLHSAYTTPFRHLPAGAKYLMFNENRGDVKSTYYLRNKLPEKEYNILALGNSFTQCYWMYVPAILHEWFGDNTKFNIYVGMLGGSTFTFWKNWVSGTNSSKTMSVTFHNSWKSYRSDLSASSLFSSVKFDLVGFQPQSSNAASYGWGSEWVAAVDAVSELSSKHIDFMWTMVHAKPNNATTEGAEPDSTDVFMRKIFTAHQSFAAAYPIDICPVGTAIQNARHTSINNLEWAGSDPSEMTPDGLHLQNGFACFIAGLVVARCICKKLGVDTPCYGDKMEIDAAFDAAYSKLSVYGTNPVYSTGASMNYLAQRCVESALKFPFEIKNVSTGGTITE